MEAMFNRVRRIRLVAHRGGVRGSHENTLRAFSESLSRGADAFECDVTLTRDGEPVVIHLPFYTDSVAGLSDRRVRIGNADWRELADLTVNGERIPHLVDMLTFLKGTNAECFIEPKRPSLELTEKVVRGVRDADLVGRVWLITFFPRRKILQHAKNILPALRTGVIVIFPFKEWQRIAVEASADAIIPGWKSFNHLRLLECLGVEMRERVAAAQRSGLRVFSGIADDERDLKWLCELGVDAIFTNDIEHARTHLDRWAMREM